MIPPNSPQPNGRILVVDDESLYAEMLYSILRQHHYPADMTDDPQKAKEMILENDYGLLITDYQMPQLNGVQLVEAIRDAGFSIPVIIISGMMHTPELQRAVNMGITTVLQKPTGTQNFLAQVNRYVPRPEPRAVSQSTRVKGSRAPMHLKGRTGHRTTYPQVQHHVPGKCFQSRCTLQKLWDQSKMTNQIFLHGARGGDLAQHARELATWKGYGDAPLNFLHVSDLANPRALLRLKEITENGKLNELVVVDCRSENLAEFLPALQEHINKAESYSSGSRELTFLYWLENDNWQTLKDGFDPDLFDLCAGGLVTVHPLNERLPDLAHYAGDLIAGFARKAKKPERTRLSPEALHRLLQNCWDGNFAELGLVLWRAIQAGDDEEITGEEMAEALTAAKSESIFDPETPPLEGFLALRQHRYIQLNSDSDATQDAPLGSSELGELMYPEIVQLDASDAA